MWPVKGMRGPEPRRSFRWRLAAQLLAGALLTLPASADQRHAAAAPDVVGLAVAARPIAHFSRTDPARRRFGRLEFRGGLVLSAPERRFGGWSGLVLAPDGRRFLAIGDEGSWLSGTIRYKGEAPDSLGGVVLGPLLGRDGRAHQRKRDSDAEEVTLLSGTLERGTVLVAYERRHRIERYHVVDGRLGVPSGRLRMPREARQMRSNSGLEAMTVLRGGPHKGAVVAFAEDPLRGTHDHTGWLWLDGRPQALAVVPRDGFSLTGAASLADGSLLLLERRFRITEGVRMRLRLIPAREIRPHGRLDGEILFTADSSYEIDNMEGVAVHTGARGETVVTLISDDNFNRYLQRTLLLQFTLLPAGSAPAAPAR